MGLHAVGHPPLVIVNWRDSVGAWDRSRLWMRPAVVPRAEPKPQSLIGRSLGNPRSPIRDGEESW